MFKFFPSIDCQGGFNKFSYLDSLLDLSGILIIAQMSLLKIKSFPYFNDWGTNRSDCVSCFRYKLCILEIL